METIFRDEDLYTIDIISYNEKKTDNDYDYGFYCDLESEEYDINNDIFYQREIKHNKILFDEQIQIQAYKHFEKKYKVYADYCMFGLIVFSCSMLLF